MQNLSWRCAFAARSHVLPQVFCAPTIRVLHRRSFASPAATPAAKIKEAAQEFLSPSRVHNVFNPRVGVEEGASPSWVSDIGRLLTEEDRNTLDDLCMQVHAAWRAEVAVVILNSLPDDIHPSGFAAALLNYWGIGDAKLHTGLLILLLTEQRRVEMRVGYGADRLFSAEFRQELQEKQMVPNFRAGKPGLALCEGLRGVLAAMETSGLEHWRRKGSSQSSLGVNKHGFGGGQTSVDEFMQPDDANQEQPTGTGKTTE